MSDATPPPPPDDDQDPDACPNCLLLIGPRTHWKDEGFPGYSCAMANEINLRVQDAVVAERNRQDGLWGEVQDLTHSLDKWNTLVVEEIGEAAKALNDGDPAQMMVELVQAAATIHSWLESIEWRAKLRHDEENVRRVRQQRADDAVARYEANHGELHP